MPETNDFMGPIAAHQTQPSPDRIHSELRGGVADAEVKQPVFPVTS
jgi:hypothetical protein